MAYKVLITPDAEADLDRFIAYLINEKNSKQAARNVLDDFEATIQSLSLVVLCFFLCVLKSKMCFDIYLISAQHIYTN